MFRTHTMNFFAVFQKYWQNQLEQTTDAKLYLNGRVCNVTVHNEITNNWPSGNFG